MTSEAELIVKRFHSDYFFEPETLTDDYIIHHHKLRDRSAVNQARILAKRKRVIIKILVTDINLYYALG